MKTVKVHLKHQSNEMEFKNVINTYQKGDLFCVLTKQKQVYKFPVQDIFRIIEDY